MATNSTLPEGDNAVPGKAERVAGDEVVNEKSVRARADVDADDDGPDAGNADASAAKPALVSSGDNKKEAGDEEIIVVTGHDAAQHLLPLRDDGEPALTLRSIFLASCLSAFQAVMSQIYSFKPTGITVSGIFIVLIAYFAGKAWAALLPRGDRHEAQWRQTSRHGTLPLWIRALKLVNPGPWNLKEHAVCAISATSASNAAASITVFAAQNLFYDLPLSATTVVLSTISIGLFGYGVCGVLRPICVWHVESVYWSTLPTVKTLQGLHWQDVKKSKPIRVFWYSFVGMAVYEIFPAYVFPWLNSVSIPCLAAMNATGAKASLLTNLFGGATNNEGLGILSLSLDWQYITSFQTSVPLKLQTHQAAGFFVCFIAMLSIYYTNAWDAKSQPFMSTRLRTQSGEPYPTAKLLSQGVLDQSALAQYGIPRLAGSFAYAMFIANAAIGALVAHCVLFWGRDFVQAYKTAKAGRYDDRHHAYMAKHYREVPWWWYTVVLVSSFILGLVVVVREDITLPVWAYLVALLVGIIIAPLVSALKFLLLSKKKKKRKRTRRLTTCSIGQSTVTLARYGNGIGTNNISKMLAGLMIPGRPIGNMYFSAWSHTVIVNCVALCGDLKMGEYLKIPPRVMFLTQIYGTVLGGFINYAVMIAIVNGNRDLLANSNGNASWSGASIQSYNTNAISWALAKYLFGWGRTYSFVPFGLAIGAGIVALHRLVAYFVPRVKGFALAEIHMPQFIQYAGYIPYNQSQTCVIFSWIIAGFFTQFYLRNYKPRLFKDYMYLVTGAFDGASLFVLFILSFAVFGAGGKSIPFPAWWGNNAGGTLDHCPVGS